MAAFLTTDVSRDVSSELPNKLNSLTAYNCASHAGMCLRYDINDMISGKLQLQLVPDEGQSHIMGDVDFKVGTRSAIAIKDAHKLAHLLNLLQGRDWNSQVKLGNGGFYGLYSTLSACIHAVCP